MTSLGQCPLKATIREHAACRSIRCDAIDVPPMELRLLQIQNDLAKKALAGPWRKLDSSITPSATISVSDATPIFKLCGVRIVLLFAALSMGWPTTVFMQRLIPAIFAALSTLPSRSRNKVVRPSLAFQPSLRRESETRTREMTDNRLPARKSYGPRDLLFKWAPRPRTS